MLPILYSFRRCPYAIRARMALCYSGVQCELREVVLRDKAPEFLQVSASGTVPTLVLEDQVLDESFDIMRWAMDQSDPEGWLEMPEAGYDLVEETDGPFKKALDRTKYASRYPDANKDDHLRTAQEFLKKLDSMLDNQHLFADTPRLADVAIFPFVRQFAFIDKTWFDAQDWPRLHRWLESHLASELFLNVMPKYPKWQSGDGKTLFPQTI